MLFVDDPLHLERRRAGERVREIGMAVLEGSRALPDRVDDRAACEHRADRLVAAAQSLGDGLDVGRNALLFPRMQRAGAAHAAHHLVEDEQGAVPVADVAHGPEVTFGRRHASGGGSDDGLGNECGYRVGAEALEFGLQFGSQPRHKISFGFIVALLVIRECRRHVAEGGRQQRRIGFAAPGVSACRQRAECIAMIALATGDEALALRLTAFDKILPRQFDAGFDRFRSAADEVGVGEAARFVADEQVGQRLRRLRGEKAGMGISELRRLPGDGLDHARMLMSETGNGSSAGAIENPAAILGNEPHAVAADGLGGRFAQASMQYAAGAGAHHFQPFSATYCRHRGEPGFRSCSPWRRPPQSTADFIEADELSDRAMEHMLHKYAFYATYEARQFAHGRRSLLSEGSLCCDDIHARTARRRRLRVSMSSERLAGLFWQIVVVGIAIAVVAWLWSNALHNLSVRRISTGFAFLGREAGMPIADAWLAYSPKNTYLRAFIVGIVNTLRVAVHRHRAGDRARDDGRHRAAVVQLAAVPARGGLCRSAP